MLLVHLHVAVLGLSESVQSVTWPSPAALERTLHTKAKTSAI